MWKLLLGLLMVGLLVTAVMAQDAKTDRDKHKNRVITLVNKGSSPTYKLLQKYAPGKYSVTVWYDSVTTTTAPQQKNNVTIYQSKKVFTVEASKVDEKGNQTLKIWTDEIEVSSSTEDKVHVSRTDPLPEADRTAEDSKDKTDTTQKGKNDTALQINDQLSSIVHAGPCIVMLDASGNVASTENIPAMPKIAESMKQIYSSIEETRLYPEIGVGGVIKVEDDMKLQDIATLRGIAIAKLTRVEKLGNDTIGYVYTTFEFKNKPEIDSDDPDDIPDFPTTVTIDGKQNLEFNFTTGLMMNTTVDFNMKIVFKLPQGNTEVDRKTKCDIKIEKK